MPQRSADRQQGERLDSSQDISWTQELKFYFTMAVLAQILYFAGSEALVKYHEWIRQRTATAISSPPATPQPVAAPVITAQQQQMLIVQARQHAQEQIIRAMTQAAQIHPEKKAREAAAEFLRQNGIEQTPSVPSMLLAQGKG